MATALQGPAFWLLLRTIACMISLIPSLYCVGDQQQACPSKNGGATEARMSLGVWSAAPQYLKRHPSLSTCFSVTEEACHMLLPPAVCLRQLLCCHCSLVLWAFLRCLCLIHHHPPSTYGQRQSRGKEGELNVNTAFLTAASTFKYGYARGHKSNAVPRIQNANS